tara:strand:+ start:2120 stop:2671 length:552 start_codon:yes stop_codon:yes gene_type:complete
MCDPMTMAVASFGLQAGSAYMEYQGQKDMAEYTDNQNAIARESAWQAYKEDQMRIDAEQITKNEETARERFKIQRDKRDALATARASAGEGKGMLYALMRDVGFDADFDTNVLEADVIAYNRYYIDAEKDAYAAFTRNWYNQPVANRPSALGLAINVASAGVNSYSTYKSGGYGESKGEESSS